MTMAVLVKHIDKSESERAREKLTVVVIGVNVQVWNLPAAHSSIQTSTITQVPVTPHGQRQHCPAEHTRQRRSVHRS